MPSRAAARKLAAIILTQKADAMTATMTKTASFSADAIRAQVRHLDNLPPAERFARREEIKFATQRAWIRNGKVGINPLVLF